MTKIYIGEFEPSFLKLLSAIADAAPLELFANPKVYLHNLLEHDSCPSEWRNAKTLQAKITDVGFAYHDKIETTQIAVFLKIAGSQKGYTVYASLVNDAYRNRSSRTFARSMFTSLLEMDLTLQISVYEIDAASDNGKLLIGTFAPLTWESMV